MRTLSEEQIARVCHEANRAYCMAIGDHSIGTWDTAPHWQKESALEGVANALKDPSLTPEKSHESWLAHKLKAGWKHGLKKRPEVLEHPCMVPYDQLPVEQRLKDALFLAVVRALGGDPPSPVVVPSPDLEVAAKLPEQRDSSPPESVEVTKDVGPIQDLPETPKPKKKR